MLKHIKEEEFEKEVLKNEKRVLVDFYADWCGPCQKIAPILEKISENNKDVDIIKVNVDEAQDLSMQYGVMSIPTLIVFEKGKEINKMVGFSNEEALNTMLNK